MSGGISDEILDGVFSDVELSRFRSVGNDKNMANRILEDAERYMPQRQKTIKDRVISVWKRYCRKCGAVPVVMCLIFMETGTFLLPEYCVSVAIVSLWFGILIGIILFFC